MSKNKLYTTLLMACFFGYTYLLYHLFFINQTHFGVCLIKNTTGFACPSCGTTRAVQLLIKGDFYQSILTNPFGIIVATLMIILPVWILFDVITKKETFYYWYKKTEKIIRTKWIAITLVVLVLLNWIWNIYKNL